MKSKLLLALLTTTLAAGTAVAQVKVEDAIKFRQSGYGFMAWNMGRIKAKGLTVVPLSLYIDDRGRAKVQLAIARGKQLHDRRRDIADRDARRDMQRELADIQRGR